VVRAHGGLSNAWLESEGPQITQAGLVNYQSATAALGFSSGYRSTYFPYPWPDNVRCFAHPTTLADVGE
jgi:hypothetical protein